MIDLRNVCRTCSERSNTTSIEVLRRVEHMLMDVKPEHTKTRLHLDFTTIRKCPYSMGSCNYLRQAANKQARIADDITPKIQYLIEIEDVKRLNHIMDILCGTYPSACTVLYREIRCISSERREA